MDAEYVAVCRADEVGDGDVLAFEVPGHEDSRRVLVNLGGRFHGLSGVCPHLGADLGEGIVERGVLLCPHHGSGFDCRSGEAVHPPADRPLASYGTAVRDGIVYVRVDP